MKFLQSMTGSSLFLLGPFVAAFLFGYSGFSLIAPFIMAIVPASYMVWVGWRYQYPRGGSGGAALSILMGTFFWSLMIVPVFLVANALAGIEG